MLVLALVACGEEEEPPRPGEKGYESCIVVPDLDGCTLDLELCCTVINRDGAVQCQYVSYYGLDGASNVYDCDPGMVRSDCDAAELDLLCSECARCDTGTATIP